MFAKRIPKRALRLTAYSTVILCFLILFRTRQLDGSRASTESDVQPTTVSEPKQRVNILHYNTHGGCSLNLNRVLELVFKGGGTTYSVKQYNPSHLGYGLTHENASSLVSTGMYAKDICLNQDVIVVSDTIPHARGLLLSLLETNSAKKCTSKVILEITNRFDYALSSKRDIKLYYHLFRRLAELTQRSDSLFWVANNNFERAYMEYRLGVSLPFVQVLRPLGITGDDSDYSYPADLPAPNRSILVALNHSNTNVFKLAQNSYSVPLFVIPDEHTHYGGPKSLHRFKGFVEFPYQVSTMKLYENLAAGVILLIPTPRFLEQLWLNHQHDIFYFMHVLRDLTPSIANFYNRKPPLYSPPAGFPSWSGYMDYYAAEFAPYIYYFDSFEELKSIAEMNPADLDWKGVRKGEGKFFKQSQTETIEGWKRLFRTIGCQV